MTEPAKPSAPTKPRFGKGQPAHFCGKPGRSGPKAGNLNALKNGANLIARTRLVVGELPKQLISARKEGRAYRRQLEAAVLEIKGEINTLDAHLIDTASAATIAAAIGRWVLRHKLEGMRGSDVLACSREIIKSKQARDAAVKSLGLDAPPKNPWEIDVDAGEDAGEDDDAD